MVKNSKNSKMMKKQQPRQRRQPKAARAVTEADVRVANHTTMVMDPCNSKVAPTAYRGQDGFVQRFARTNAFTTTTGNSFIYIFYPAYNSYYLSELPLGTTTIPIIAYNGTGPGQAFLLTNADAQRAIAGCISVDYTGTELNRQGVLYSGLVKQSVFQNTNTVDNLCALLGHPVRMPDTTHELKWIPSPVEEEYWSTGAAVPESAGDRNVMVVIGTGFTNPVQMQFTTTLIVEWQPNAGLGIAASTPNTADAPGGLERVRSNLSRAGNWWVGAARSIESGYNTARDVYQATRGVRAGIMALTAA